MHRITALNLYPGKVTILTLRAFLQTIPMKTVHYDTKAATNSIISPYVSENNTPAVRSVPLTSMNQLESWVIKQLKQMSGELAIQNLADLDEVATDMMMGFEHPNVLVRVTPRTYLLTASEYWTLHMSTTFTHGALTYLRQKPYLLKVGKI